MNTKMFFLLVLLMACMVCTGIIAYADVPDPSRCSATSAGGALYICPQGDGETLSQAGATITVTVLDADGLPCVGYPKENIWVSSIMIGEIELCPETNMADTDTDTYGITTISGTIAGGGHTQNGLYVFIDGEPILGSPLDIDVNSVDITGDLNNNLCDMIILYEDLETYNYRSDLDHNSDIGFEDLIIHSIHGGHTCQSGGPAPDFQVSGEIGVFFDQAGTETGILGILPNIPFNFYIVAFDASGGILGYMFGLMLDQNIEITNEITYPAGSNNFASYGQVRAITGGICLPDEGPVVLVEYEAILTSEVNEVYICLEPVAQPFPGEPGGPAYVTCLGGCDWRIFLPAYSGCAIVNGEGAITNIPSTWGAVKNIYRK